VLSQIVWVSILATARRIAFSVIACSHRCPLRQIGFAEQYTPGGSKVGYHRRIIWDFGAQERRAARCCLLSILCGDVVFHEERDSVDNASQFTVVSLDVQYVGDIQAVRVGLDDGSDAWVDQLDSFQVALREIAARE
jgi:hypothetical protein